MVIPRTLAVLVGCFCLEAPVAAAAPLNWEGTLTLSSAPGGSGLVGGGVATVNGSASVGGALQTLQLVASRGNLSGCRAAGLTPTIAPAGFVSAELGSGTLAPIVTAAASTATLSQGVLPVRGVGRLCLVSTDCTNAISVPLTQSTTSGIIGMGIGGLLTLGGDSPVRISIVGAPWTIKSATVLDQITATGNSTASLTVLTAKGFAQGPSGFIGSTAQPGGIVQLVTPIQIATNITSGSNAVVGDFGVLRIRFIPEPEAGLLLVSAAFAAAWLYRSRRTS